MFKGSFQCSVGWSGVDLVSFNVFGVNFYFFLYD